MRRFALFLGLVASILTASPALAWSPVSIRIGIGVPAAQVIAPLAVGGVVVAPRVIFRPDGQIVFGAVAGVAPVAVAESEPLRELVVYEPDGFVRTVAVRDRDYPVYERFLLAHHARFYWRAWQPEARPAYVPLWPSREVRPEHRDRDDDARYRDDRDGGDRPGNGWGWRR
ncbi:MAG: hypothetical protein KGR26_08725 [Cyanobacteria bacterium REEB65]|nr:hypothetical protein [Cyanobacteria bacterium REEB65]